jgi:hypothetical protein
MKKLGLALLGALAISAVYLAAWPASNLIYAAGETITVKEESGIVQHRDYGSERPGTAVAKTKVH